MRLKKRCFPWLVSLLALGAVLMLSYKHSDVGRVQTALTTPDNTELFHRYNVNCSALYDMDPVEVGRSLVLRKQALEDKDESLVKLTSNCYTFLKSRGYENVCISEEEKHFPIAYSLVVHKNAWMVERIIKALYSPSNVFCIHYDQKSSVEFSSAMEGLAHCLPNVFIATNRESVFYASMSRLKADLNCMSDLLRSEVQWKYLFNLCGQDFPLRSNIELVAELTKLKGANMLETSRPTQSKRDRFKYHHELRDANFEYHKLPVGTHQEKTPPPHGIEMFTGNAYFTLSRDFVEFINSSNVVKDFLAWSEDTYSPDEHFWATLVRLPGVPGEIPRSQPDITDLMSKTRLVKWSYLEESLYPVCTGDHIRSVCIYGVGEMHWLLNYGHWFANKFDPKVDPIIIQCLEEYLQKKQNLYQSFASRDCTKKGVHFVE